MDKVPFSTENIRNYYMLLLSQMIDPNGAGNMQKIGIPMGAVGSPAKSDFSNILKLMRNKRQKFSERTVPYGGPPLSSREIPAEKGMIFK